MDSFLQQDFEKTFTSLYRPLCLYALNITKTYEEAEDIVQQLFIDIWERICAKDFTVTNLKSYLFTAVKNRSLNYYNKENQQLPLEDRLYQIPQEDNEAEQIRMAEREARLWDLIDELPQERRNIFLMAKQKGMKYQEIAEELHLSIKTVENQMGRALKSLREKAIKIYLFFFG